MGEIVSFASNGGSCPGYLAQPPGGGPGVVVIQEWWGLVPHIASVCDRFAAAGFTALAPDLYHGASASEPDEAQKAMMAMRLDEAARDMSGAVDEVASRSGSDAVGAVGFCMGGGLALVLACRRPDKVRAVVPFYGVIPWPGAEPDWAAMSAAMQGHYATEDSFAGPEAAHSLETDLRALHKRAEVFIYPGTVHGFFNDSRPGQHDAAASGQAWERTLAFLRAELAVP